MSHINWLRAVRGSLHSAIGCDGRASLFVLLLLQELLVLGVAEMFAIDSDMCVFSQECVECFVEGLLGFRSINSREVLFRSSGEDG